MTDAVTTGCSAIDELLGGGFERGTVTQVYGPPAAGKSNLALSAAVAAAIDGGRVLYIDTEGVSADRFRQLIEASLPSASAEAAAPLEEDATPPIGNEDATPSIEDVAERVVISEALDFDEQAEAVQDAAEFAPSVELIVLDSATGFYRLERTDDEKGGEALRAVARQTTHLLSLARRYDLAVVLTNQVFTDPDTDRVRGLGGHTLDHWTGIVLRLDRFRGGNRRATLEKHHAKAAGESVTFRITESGVETTDEFRE